MTITKRSGFDWECQAPDCGKVVEYHTNQRPPDEFVVVQIQRGDLLEQHTMGHACSASCAEALAHELYVKLYNAYPTIAGEGVQDPEGLATKA